MATLTIEGHKVNIDDAFMQLSPEEQDATVEEIARELNLGGQPQSTEGLPVGVKAAPGHGMSPQDMQAGLAEMSGMTQQLGAGRSAMDPEEYDRGLRAALEASKLDRMSGGAATRPQVDPLFGWTDELYSNTVGAGARMLRDGVGYGEARLREQALQDELQTRARKAHPVMSTVNDIASGVMTGGALAKGGLTLAGKSLPVIGKTGAAALEGAGYGAVSGAGYGKQGEKTQGAITGGVTGAIAGGVLSKVGDKLASRAAAKAVPAPTSQAIKSEAKAVYDQAYKSGTVITKAGTNKLVDNMTLAAGRPNPNLRPKTLGIMDDLRAMKNKPMDIEAFHELRQSIGAAMKNADDQDVRTLLRMQEVLDGAETWMTGKHVSNGTQGMELLKTANSIYARGAKTGKLETLLDLADVKSARYSQSGMANALRDKASQLYTKIQNGTERGFTPQEVAIVRDLATGKHSGIVKSWLAKFAPRGPVSGGIGAGIGATVGGAVAGPAGSMVGMAVPGAVGHVAARGVDKAATRMALGLRDLAARGGPAALPQMPNRLLPFIPGVTIGAQGLLQPQAAPRR